MSIVIPLHNEEGCVEEVILDITDELRRENVPYEIVAVNDNSTDKTRSILAKLAAADSGIRIVDRKEPPGFGRAIREGIANSTGDCVAIVMGDASDDPKDIVKYYRKLGEGYDCAFGTRFVKDSVVRDYPLVKLLVNRLANTFIRILFFLGYNDVTNAFKAYRREVLDAVSPIQALSFNITAEIPLKAIVRGYSYAVIPTNWYGRTSGVSKLRITHLGRRYLFTVLHVWLEKMLIKDDLPRKHA
jgi:dolichol-phosphate mannosyltransferase